MQYLKENRKIFLLFFRRLFQQLQWKQYANREYGNNNNTALHLGISLLYLVILYPDWEFLEPFSYTFKYQLGGKLYSIFF